MTYQDTFLYAVLLLGTLWLNKDVLRQEFSRLRRASERDYRLPYRPDDSL